MHRPYSTHDALTLVASLQYSTIRIGQAQHPESSLEREPPFSTVPHIVVSLSLSELCVDEIDTLLTSHT